MRTEVMAFNKKQRKDSIVFYAGDVVRVHRKIKEGDKERVQVFEGMIIAIKGGQSSSPMMTVRKVSNDVGVEIVVPLFSPNIEKIELVKRAKVRKSKLYYVRDKAAKALRFTFTDASDIVDQTGEEKDGAKEETPKKTEDTVKEEEKKAEESEKNEHTK